MNITDICIDLVKYMKINIKNSITTMNESEFLEAVEKSKTMVKNNNAIIYFDLYREEGEYVVSFEFRIKETPILTFNTGLTRKIFFKNFQSSQLINGKYLYVGSHDWYDAYYISYRKEGELIHFENLYYQMYEEIPFEDDELELKKEFLFTIKENALGHYINCFKNLEI